MFSSSSLLSLLLVAAFAVNVDASPCQRRASTSTSILNFAAKINTVGLKNVAEIDRLRVAHHRATGLLSNGTGKRDGVEGVTDPTAVQYTASVGVGSPATQYTLLIDTGSSNTWVGSTKAYKKTSTSKKTGETISVTYGSGHMTGDEYTDTVSFGNGLTIKNQSIGVATQWQGFRGIDGILGVGPVGLTATTLSSKKQVPTVVDNLASQKTISQSVLGIFFAPGDSHAGSLSFGQPEQDKVQGDITYVPITKTTPAANYWGFEQSVHYNGKQILKNTAGTVDTGTTLTLIASDAYSAYKNATGATLDYNTGFLSITSAQYSKLKNLDFKIGGKMFTLNANAQIWPRSLNSAINGESDKIYLIISDVGSNSGSGLDFVMGFTWLQRFYTVYDTGKKQVGFAKTSYTDATTN